MAPFCFRRGTSCGGGSLIRSTSPETSAASRVASEAIGVKITSSTLPSNRPSLMPHQFGFFTHTVFTSGSRDFSMYGPVPLA
jgi:hypothetical protein